MTKENRTVWNQLNLYKELIVSILGGMLTTAALIKGVRDDIDLIFEIGKYAAPVTFIVVCLLVRFSQKTIGEGIGNPTKVYKYTSKERRLALVGLVLASVVLALLGSLKFTKMRVNAEVTTILITQFDSSGQADLGTREVIHSNLEGLERIHPDVRILESDEVIKSSSSAQELGRKKRLTL